MLHLNPVQAWRLEVVCGLLAALLLTAFVLWITLPGTGRARAVILSVTTSSIAYLLLATLVRLTVLHHRSRWQIVTLLAIVTLGEAVRFRRSAWRVRGATWVAGSAAVCLGVLMIKWALEPGAFSAAFVRLQDRLFQ